MRIRTLKDAYHHAPRLAALHAAEWQHLYAEWDATHALQEFAVQHSDGRLPTTLIACEGDILLGSVSVIFDDLPGWEHLNPWVASFYVVQAQRRQGVGTQLLEAAYDLLRAQRIETAYLFTENRSRYFAVRGWRPFAPVDLDGHHATIMMRRFATY